MGFVYFVTRRFAAAIFVLFGVSVITFILSHSISADPITAWLGRSASLHPELVKFYVEKYHLNAPLYMQYFYYISGLLQGNLGFSPFMDEPVAVLLGRTVPYTLQLMFFTFLFTIILGILMGVLAAKFANKWPDALIRTFYLLGTAAPAFFLALALIVVFSFAVHVLPTGGTVNPMIIASPVVTGFPMLDSLLNGNWAALWSQVDHIILPSLANSLGIFGVITRVLRSSILDTLNLNYIRTVRAKGASENAVFFKHALRNSLIPVVTLLAIMVNVFIVSSIFVEHIFAYPGVGDYAVTSVLNYDYPSILGTTLLFGVMIVISNFAADLFYAIVDPRIRLT